MEYYPKLKINEPSSHEETWRKLKCMFLRKRRQSETAPYCVIPILWHSGKDRTTETVKESVATRGSGWRSGVGNGQWTTEDFRAVSLPCVILWWQTCVIGHLPKPREWTASRVNFSMTLDCGWSWQINGGSSIIRNHFHFHFQFYFHLKNYLICVYFSAVYFSLCSYSIISSPSTYNLPKILTRILL